MKQVIVFTISIILLAACQQNNEKSLLQERQGNSEVRYVTDSDPIKKQKLTSQQIASRLAKTAVEVPDVHDSTAIVFGDYVAVGIDIDKDLDRSRAGVVKYSVAEALKHDPYGKQAIVIADADGIERLRGLGQKISQGHPVEAVTDELSQIVARYIPQGPINEQTPSNPNQESVPKQEKKQLNKFEKEQSKQE